MNEYPKQMRTAKGQTVTVLGPPDAMGLVPTMWPTGRYSLSSPGIHGLRPLPSPDDEVEVVVTMTRAQRDYIAGTTPVSVADNWSPVVDACRAHRDAEEVGS